MYALLFFSYNFPTGDSTITSTSKMFSMSSCVGLSITTIYFQPPTCPASATQSASAARPGSAPSATWPRAPASTTWPITSRALGQGEDQNIFLKDQDVLILFLVLRPASAQGTANSEQGTQCSTDYLLVGMFTLYLVSRLEGLFAALFRFPEHKLR